MSYKRMVELKQDIRKANKLKKQSETKAERRAYDRLEYILTCWKDAYKGRIDV